MSSMPLHEFERLLTVSLIMTPRPMLRVAELGTPLEDVRGLFEPDFSQLPVLERDRVVGLLPRSKLDAAVPGALVDASSFEQPAPTLQRDAPLSLAIETLVRHSAVLVTDENRLLVGLIHYSDLNRHPVRLLFYFLLANLEMSLAEGIREVFGSDDKWVVQLSEPRQIQIIGITEWERRRDMRIDTVEATELRDVIEVASRIREVQRTLGLDKEQVAGLRGLVHLRNSTMHPVRRLVRSHDQVKDLHDRLLRLRQLAGSPSTRAS